MLLLLFSSAIFAEIAEPRKQELRELRLLPYKEFYGRIYSFTAEERAFLIAEQRKFIQDQENDVLMPVPPDEAALATLWRLGDDYGLEKYTERFKQRFPSSLSEALGAALAVSANPRVIEILAPELFRDEPAFSPTRRSSDVLLNEGSLSGECARIIWVILSESPEFSGEVTNWARRVDDLRQTNWGPLKELREVLLEWWPENEQFFKERNYKAVQPGRDVFSQETKVAKPLDLPAPPDGISALGNSPNVSASPMAVPADVSNNGRLFLITSFALFSALLGGIWFYWKRRA